MGVKGAVKKRNPAHENLEYPLSPFTLAMSFAGNLTHLPIGPSTGIFIPIISNSWPFSYVAVILLDIFAALAVRRDWVISGQIPTLFETAWRNPEQEAYLLGTQRIPQPNLSPSATPAPAPNDSISNGSTQDPATENPTDKDPLFPPGVSINLVLDTPLHTNNHESSAVFIYQVTDFPNVPSWLLPIVSFIIYSISHILWRNKKDGA